MKKLDLVRVKEFILGKPLPYIKVAAVGNPMAALEWLVKKGNEAGLPDKYKGRESYGGDK
ncbi:MAG: hypothetical protein RR797_04010 [Christensenella sp.]